MFLLQDTTMQTIDEKRLTGLCAGLFRAHPRLRFRLLLVRFRPWHNRPASVSPGVVRSPPKSSEVIRSQPESFGIEVRVVRSRLETSGIGVISFLGVFLSLNSARTLLTQTCLFKNSGQQESEFNMK